MIDLLLGGSPCQGFSKTVSNNINFEHEGSRLFFEYAKVLKMLKPKYFLLENVPMEKWCQDTISEYVGVEPIVINSNLVSAQDRERLYWTNIKGIEQPNDKKIILADILQPVNEVDDKYWYNVPFDYHGNDSKVCATLHISGHDILKRVNNPAFKSATLTACRGGNLQKKVYQDGRCRKLTPLEYERLQTLSDGYTEGISDSQRYNSTGNGWTADVIAHILSYIPEIYLHSVVGLFDGISCGQVALERAGKVYNQYYASEIDKYAIQIAQKNYPHTMQLGDVTKIDWETFEERINIIQKVS
jgi:site-specific DNA-cytosine methylase